MEKQECGMGDYAKKSSDRRRKKKHVNEEKAEIGSVSEKEELRRLRNEEVSMRKEAECLKRKPMR
jgi:hypothetical protein